MIENGNMVALILLDLSAAFDTVDHEILTTRLRTDFGLISQVLKWIVSYHTNRSFSVNIRKEHSNRQWLNYGVPQGSLLGPILFIMYTIDTTKIATKHTLSIHMYADDTQLYIGFQASVPCNVAITESTIHECVDKMKQLMKGNYLKINAGKTTFIVIDSPHQVRNCQNNNITLIKNEDGKELEKLNTVLSLGVNIDSTLSLKHFVNTKCSEAYSKLRNISKLRYCLDTPMWIMLVRNLILSKLDYCNAILANIPKWVHVSYTHLMVFKGYSKDPQKVTKNPPNITKRSSMLSKGPQSAKGSQTQKFIKVLKKSSEGVKKVLKRNKKSPQKGICHRQITPLHPKGKVR